VTKQKLIEKNKEQESTILALKQENDMLKKMIFGSKSERFKAEQSADQLSLFAQEAEAGKEEEEQNQMITYERKSGKKHEGRNAIPEHLPVEEVIIEPEQDTTGMKKIGEEITETLKYTPASLVKIKTIRPKYARPEEQGIVIAPLSVRPIPKSYAEASLLTHIFISKFIDHLPFYRQRQIFKRDFEWELASSTINDWFIACCTLLEPLYKRLIEKILSCQYIQADESTIKVQDDKKQGKTHLGYQWVYHSPEQGLVYFHYHKGRGQSGPKEILGEYEGYVQCDGYKVYDKIATGKAITLVGCMAHLRRKFQESLDNDKVRASQALELIQSLYAIEREMRDQHLPTDKKTSIRNTKSKPIMLKLKAWIDEEEPKVLPKSRIGKAMRYGLYQWDKLMQFTNDGRLEIDNNLTENSIRPLALGRKNYLFAGSHQAAERIAMMYSFFGTCKKQGVNPRTWLQQTLEKIAEHPINRIEELLPKKAEV